MSTTTAEKATELPKKLGELTSWFAPLAIDSDRTYRQTMKWVDEYGLSGRDLGRILGQAQLGGKILRGERELSKNHIRTLCAHFKVGPELFL